MATWLFDTALVKLLASPRAASLQRWCETNNASLYLSAVSLTEVAGAIHKIPSSQAPRALALRKWLDEVTERFADRIHSVDPAIARRAGDLLPRLTVSPARHRLHDALLVATAQTYSHGLLTRRDGVFRDWTDTPVVLV